jgi:hypothetical protein
VQLIRTLARKEPAATLAVLSWAAGATMALAGKPEFAPVLVAVGAALLGLRTQVVPKAKAAETTTQAATQAAMEVAKNLTDGTAGAVGELTGAAAGVVDDALALVAGLTGGKK